MRKCDFCQKPITRLQAAYVFKDGTEKHTECAVRAPNKPKPDDSRKYRRPPPKGKSV